MRLVSTAASDEPASEPGSTGQTIEAIEAAESRSPSPMVPALLFLVASAAGGAIVSWFGH